MFIHFGTQMCGKVDQVPGLFHVATKFAHLNFVPLVPLGSYIVLESLPQDADEPGGVPIDTSGKSIFFAYVRMMLWAGISGASTFALFRAVRWAEGRGHGGLVFASALLVLLCAGLLPLSYRITRAGPLRALVLARRAGLEPEDVAPFFLDTPDLPGPDEVERQEV